jgi:hypothetical protein
MPGEALWASIDHEGIIWMVNRNMEVFKTSKVSLWTHNYDWIPVSGSCKKVYASNKDNIACVDTAGKVYRYIDSNFVLVSSSRGFENIAISTTGGAVATTTKGEIYYKQ